MVRLAIKYLYFLYVRNSFLFEKNYSDMVPFKLYKSDNDFQRRRTNFFLLSHEFAFFYAITHYCSKSVKKNFNKYYTC